MTSPDLRETRFNYTSADDRQVVLLLLGAEGWAAVERLRGRRVTGRLGRLLMRVLGEVFIHLRNPFLADELARDSRRRRHLFGSLTDDLDLIGRQAGGDPLVAGLLDRVRALIETFRRQAESAPAERDRVRRRLGAVVGAENVRFDPITLVAHATDATDWRLHLPAAVAFPTATAQVQPLLAAIAALGLHAIPRGAGTGLTGGAVPLRPRCVVVNTERLDRILGVGERAFALADGSTARASVMSLEAGVVTERAMEAAERLGLVFATDPTSAWACTIGGNIAENAGGKTAVRYGTCVDNLLAWTVAMPGGTFTVRRLAHPLRKILPGDTVGWSVEDAAGREVRRIALGAGEIRRPGLWKDITNKALGGLPGLQKEGTDGVITAAEFLLHPRPAAGATLCLEFFGDDMDEASEVILELTQALGGGGGGGALAALEHFDGQYVRAIDYRVKAPRGGTPKAVLLVDLAGADAAQLKAAVAAVRALLERRANTEVAVARDAAEAARFWADRKRLGAIAARTNAFKLNEDIVLPLAALAEFSRWVDAVNLEEERENQAELARRLRDFFEQAPAAEESPELGGKLDRALGLCEEALEALSWEGDEQLRGGAGVEGLLAELRELVRGYPDLAAGIEGIVAHVRSRLVVLATHMHAGDGNVHVNIPVMSNDRAMLGRAEAAVGRLMEKAAALGGVCSGEHGIGVTKLRYLDPALLAAFAAYRREADPGGLMNPGKLEDLGALGLIFTPSFNLLELEARILRHGRLEELAQRIAHCVRCGKCKPDCCVFYPGRGLFFHPRAKNLAIGALIEALLYDSQRERAGAFELLRHLEEVADHCTLCHKCLKPCPVGIDSGAVSVLEREILAGHGFKSAPLATGATLAYLESTSGPLNRAFRAGVLGAGGAAQRLAARALRPLRRGGPGRGSLLDAPLPPPDPLGLRDLLPPCEPDQALLFEPAGAAARTVFYFPGCGSERLYGRVGAAALHLLLERGARVVLPPPYLCCGFPAYANARVAMHGRIALRDAILLAQIREMFSHLEFDAVAVTCGTCREALGALEAGRIFGCAVADAGRLALEAGPPLALAGEFLYHAPCHDSLDGRGAALLAAAGARVEAVPHCCSEAGTLALSRPDIAGAMRQRKREALAAAVAGRPPGAALLTNCPSCLTGLGRSRDLGVEPRHVAVELARALSGEGWLGLLQERVQAAQAVRF